MARSAAGDRRAGRGHTPERPQPGSARRHRLRQDHHHGQGDRRDAAPGAHPRLANKTLAAQLYGAAQELLSRQRGRVFRQLATTITSRKSASRAPDTYRTRRIPRSTSRSTACATAATCARCSNAMMPSSPPRCRASTVSASVETYSAMTFTIKRGERLDQRQLLCRPGGAATCCARAATSIAASLIRARRRHRDFPRSL